MPSLVRKLIIYAAVDGLILQPLDQRTQRADPNLHIRYTTQGAASLRSESRSELAGSASLEARGIRPVQGLLNIASNSYLVSILGREQVAQVHGSPIYVITSVALVPLTSQSEAKRAIEQAKKEIQVESDNPALDDIVDDDSSAGEGSHNSDGHISDDSLKASKPLKPPYDTARRKSQEEGNEGVAQDVIGKRGQYGRFAERWFSRKGWTSERRRVQGMSADDAGRSASVQAQEQSLSDQADNKYDDSPKKKQTQNDMTTVQVSQNVPTNAPLQKDVTGTLLQKLLRTTRLLFVSRSFFFSYDYDITRRLGDQILKSPGLPLYRRVDPLFFWNRHLALPFIENGNHAYVLPLMQGFVGQRSFNIHPSSSNNTSQSIAKTEEEAKNSVEPQKRPDADSSFLLTLISRRSVLRPGLRYLRRGVDEQGHAANSVETEQILSRAFWNARAKIYSFTQIRGSIPLFFSQSPYAFKPIPVLQHSFSVNHAAFRRHFSNLISRYGAVQIALLVDKHGGEAEIGQQYEKHTKQLVADGDSICGTKLGFEWFDFHAICRGMQFENVSILLDALDDTLDHFGATVEVAGQIQRRQQGVLRTNCMDCLDRTNVVQSACGSRALEKQLHEEGVAVNLQTDITTRWFNTLWADNGDAISKQYSSTAALKGDYTRTRKRDYRGALNDFGLTLSRYYNNVVNDYFSQAAIDYLLGNVTEQVFEEFEASMMSNDPAISMRTVRANAIDTSAKIVIADHGEDLLGGWALLSPREPNTVRTFPFEEAVLLLTDAALYTVRFDWNLEKVSCFERVDLRSVTGIVHGTFIISALTATQIDESRNVGLVINYRPGKEDITRVNTRSLGTAAGDDVGIDSGPDSARRAAITNLLDPSASGMYPRSSGRTSNQDLKFLAFKALPANSSLARVKGEEESSAISEKQMVANICDDIRRAAYGEGNGESDTGLSRDFVEEKEIVSFQEARANTGYLEQWGHSLKKLVWA
ncbi:MAG: hypothetical protein Q9211_001089 [Gyalolechia sp. 1 TL-2023]